ncbi:MAG: M1 family aminopeptidase [Saprospiraceae bacterium]
MFTTIFQYELQFWLKRPAVYLYAAVFFIMAFVFFAGSAGFFDGPSTGQQLQRWYNSPHEVNYILQYFNKFFLFLIPALVGSSIYKDYQTQAHSLLYSFPIKKQAYIFGHFFSALSLVFVVTLAVALGLILAGFLPGLDANKVGPFRFAAYVQTYLVYIFPNMLIGGLLVFATVLRTRNIYAGFGVILFLILIQKILENVLSQQPYLIALTDPFGQHTLSYLTQYWTLEERNTLQLPLNNIILWNRLLWLVIGSVAFGAAYRWFRFHESVVSHHFFKRQNNPVEAAIPTALKGGATTLHFDFSIWSQVKTAWFLSNFDFRYVLRTWLFWSLTALGLMTVLFTLGRVTNQAEMTMQAATPLILSAPTILYTTVILLITFVYTGLLLHRQRAANIEALVDITPQNNGLFMAAKFLGVTKIQFSLLAFLILVCITFQAWNGFYDFNFGLYCFHLFAVVGLELMIWTLVALFIHTLFPNFYLGLFLLLLGWIGVQGLATLGASSPLILFNLSDPLVYSDLNGYGHSLAPYFYKKIYWLLCSLLLLVLTYLLWMRGLSENFSNRLYAAKKRMISPILAIFSLLLLAFAGMAFDFHQKDQAQQQYSARNLSKTYKIFEENFSTYATLPQPKIRSVYIELDFFSESQNFSAKGKYKLINPYDFPIDTLLIKGGFDEITQVNLERPYEVIAEDIAMKFQVLKLNKSLAASDSMVLEFEVRNQANTFFSRNSNVLRNGSILGQDAFPRLVYPDDGPAPMPTDSSSKQRHYQAADAGLIQFETVVSTPSDQIGLAPGTLQGTWKKGNRQYAHYKVNAPMEYSFGFHAGNFTLRSEQWQDIKLDIYHHPSHVYNLEDMLEGMKASLSYNQKHFSIFQHEAASIVEFPNSEGSFATTYGNIVPMSEVRFLAKIEEGDQKVNLPFYVPAHELTHQWWGSQLLPAHAQGALMLTESISEYITLNIYREQFGQATAQQFLALQRGRYLGGRTGEQEEERPLMYVKSDQSYIAYGKGALAFHTLSHYLGEAQLNQILKTFLEQYRYQEAPYPTTLDLMELMEQEVPDSLDFILEDYFKQVVFHDTYIESATVKAGTENGFEVILEIAYQKTGAKRTNQFNDLLEIGFYNGQQELIELKKVRVRTGMQQLRFSLSEKPARIELDPNILLIELDRENNQRTL